MNAVFNGSYVDSSSISLGIDNRAFLYGDGLFETIIVRENEIFYLHDHIARLHRGMKILKIESPALLSAASIEKFIRDLLEYNSLTTARLKIIVWRKPGGLFIPESNEADFLILCSHLQNKNKDGNRVDFCSSVTLQESIFSEFKRLSSLPYILAGVECKEKEVDDLILLDEHGFVSECISSNLFWRSGDVYYTPSLSTGCVAGIRRKNLIEKLKRGSIPIIEVKVQPEELLNADSIFSTNVAGLYPIIQVGKKKFPVHLPEF